MNPFRWFFLLLILAVTTAQPLQAQLPGGDHLWLSKPPMQPAVTLYFFWSARCPHCLEARPSIEALPDRFDWIELASYELVEHPENQPRFLEMTRLLGQQVNSVPTFMWCGQLHTGFVSPEATGKLLIDGLARCYSEQFGEVPPGVEAAGPAEPEVNRVDVPGLGELDVSDYSIATLAVVLGGLDAFNPCAFFVLLFLLSLLVNTRSRARMSLIGGVFILVSGLVYFAFMAAWLNLFQFLGGLSVITLVAGTIAVAMGLINVKDYFRFKEGVSLSLSDQDKNRLFGRMRGLLNAERMPALLLGTVTLAIAANTYELLCTVGLPMVFTRILTLEELPTWGYYGYLALYNLVYVLPLAAIVAFFVATMGRRKLSEREGRFLKLLSGSMMTGLGLMLVLLPERLSEPLVAVGLIVFAVIVSAAVHRFFGRRTQT
ncbi:MAG: hypothetical protein ACPG4N_04135 [Gammaproteobacteria bacterium]